MFGYVVGNTAKMTDESKARYQAAYCGLCREIGARHGQAARATLTYDLTFLVMLLSSLYEPDEQSGTARCAVHPAKQKPFFINKFTSYGADMNVYLAYFKCADDWADDKNMASRVLADKLKKPCKKIESAWPRQCAVVSGELEKLGAIEKDASFSPDEAVNAFGKIMGELFVYDEKDVFAPTLYSFGSGLGRFIYLMDAAVDYKKDKKRGAYNPLIIMDKQPEEMRDTLMLLIGEAAKEFEKLPLEKDMDILRNILYGGVWQQYNAAFNKEAKGEPDNA